MLGIVRFYNRLQDMGSRGGKDPISVAEKNINVAVGRVSGLFGVLGENQCSVTAADAQKARLMGEFRAHNNSVLETNGKFVWKNVGGEVVLVDSN